MWGPGEAIDSRASREEDSGGGGGGLTLLDFWRETKRRRISVAVTERFTYHDGHTFSFPQGALRIINLRIMVMHGGLKDEGMEGKDYRIGKEVVRTEGGRNGTLRDIRMEGREGYGMGRKRN